MAYSTTTDSVEAFESETKRSAIITRCILGGVLAAGIIYTVSAAFSGPNERDVCQHMLEVLGQTDVVSCAESMGTVRDRLGSMKYKAYTSCIMDASTAQDIVTCRSRID